MAEPKRFWSFWRTVAARDIAPPFGADHAFYARKYAIAPIDGGEESSTTVGFDGASSSAMAR